MKRIFPMIGLVLFEAVADYFAGKRGKTPEFIWFAVLSLFFYLVCNSFWLFAVKNGAGLGRGSVIFAVSTVILAFAIGFFVFHEHISLLQGIGIGLGLASLVLVSI